MLAPRPINFSLRFFVLFYTLTILYSCTPNNTDTKTTSESEKDSLLFWITQVTEHEISLETKSYILKKAHKKTLLLKDDSLKSKYLAKLSLSAIRFPDSTFFRQINSEAIRMAKKTNDSSSLAETYWDLGSFFRRQAVLDSAYLNFSNSEKVFDGLGDGFSSGRLLYSMANIQSLVGDYTGSEITTIKAIEKLKPLNENANLYYCYDLLGDISKLLNEHDRALEYYNESLVYFEKSDLPIMREQSSKNNIGLVYQKQGQHKKAISYFQEVLTLDSLHVKNPRLYARALNNLGSSYLKQNQLEPLPGLFYSAYELQDSISDITGKASSTYRLAEYFLAQKDTTSALEYLTNSKILANQSNDTKRRLEVLRLLPKVDPKNGPQYTQDYITLSDSLQQQERKIRNKFARIQFETDEFIAENHLLTREKQLWSSITLSVLLLTMATLIILNQRSKNRTLEFRQQQQANNQEIFNLLLAQNEKIEEGKKLEQKRVSEELHDGVLGKMLGTRMMLIGLNKKTDSEAIAQREKAIAILQEVEGEVRSISHELSHAAYQKIHNFIVSIETLLNTIEKTSKIKIHFEYATHIDWDALSGDIKINLYRMIQETTQNAVKHANCKNISIDFSVASEFLIISIIDDGKGFEEKKEKKGIGMRNIASRLEKINGTWNLDSTIGKGTSIRFSIPVITNYHSTNINIEQEDLQEF